MIHQFQFQAMTVGCEIKIVGGSQQAAAQLAQQAVMQTRQLEQQYNFHNPDSWLNQQINSRKKSRVVIDPVTFSVLDQVRQLSRNTEQAFDITVGTLRPAYLQKSTAKAQQLYSQLQQYMGLDNWSLQQTGGELSIEFANPHCQLDLGGVIKEFAVDQAAALLDQHQVDGALINFGGDIYVLGTKKNGKKFKVAIKNPKNPEQPLFALELQDQALTTSGHYERSKKLGKKAVSHIGGKKPVDSRILSVSVVSDSVLTSGAFSTALTINPSLTIPQDISIALVDQRLQLHQDGHTLQS